MKKLFLFAIAMLLSSMAMAVPAHPGKARIVQPDGSSVTVWLHGDEYLHFSTTADGYSIVRRADGYYVYAQLGSDGQLKATSRIAHDEEGRSASEKAWLAGTQKFLMPQMSTATAREKDAELARRAKARASAARKEPEYDYNNFRGLIILVQYNDREFSRPDYASIFGDIVNKPNYKGYDNTQSGRYTGSVRDYFYDNSAGLFSPEFDIVGPVTIDYSQYDAQGTNNAPALTIAAIDSADVEVDFSQYDRDGDGTVDMIYFVFAGIGANIGGNDGRLLWPHASYIYNPDGYPWWVERDGVSMGRYACSTELYGTAGHAIIDGIGVICHEFSHVLGLMDLYDTDYEGGGGQSSTPDEWAIMASGGYLNNGRTPSGYTLYERYAIGFATPQLLSSEGAYTLEAIGESNTGFKLATPVRKEFFLIENRQQSSKWDRYLPGHGMMVYRIDSTNTRMWEQNQVNSNPKHNYFELVRAGGSNTASASDPFPGSKKVTLLNNSTSPGNLLTWTGKMTPFGFENIAEHSGVITFDLIDVNILKSISLPETAILGEGLTSRLEETRYPDTAPYTLQWSSSNTDVASVDANGVVSALKVGKADITVVANNNPELTATCHLTVNAMAIGHNIAEYKALPTDTEAALMLNNAQVVFINGNDIYLRDETGAICLSDIGLTFETGDVLNGSICGKLHFTGGVAQLQAAEGLTNANGYSVISGRAVKPRELHVADVTPADYGDLLTLKAVRLVSDGGLWAAGGDNRLRIYNTFKLKNISVPKDYQGRFYDITGIYLTSTLKGNTIDELALTDKLVEVDTPSLIKDMAADVLPPDTPATVFTADGRLAATTVLSALRQLPLRQGIYIVKAGDSAWRFAK